jgi:hypothetical protein
MLSFALALEIMLFLFTTSSSRHGPEDTISNAISPTTWEGAGDSAIGMIEAKTNHGKCMTGFGAKSGTAEAGMD